MLIKDSYRTIKVTNIHKQKIKKSTLISQAYPLDSQHNLQKILKGVKQKYHDASHHPYAYKIGMENINFKSSDDGEPSGSAGKPILEAIKKYDLTNVLLVVSRYFGGVKLGVGGLRKAFFNSAEECIKSAYIVEKFLYENMKLEFEYEFVNGVMRFLEKENINISNNESGEMVKLYCSIRLSETDMIKTNLLNITKGSIRFLKVED